MLALIAWYVNVLTEVLSWGSFFMVGLAGFVLLLGQKRKILGSCCVGYVVVFLIVRCFFANFYFDWMPAITIFLTIIGLMRSRYHDCVEGKRWWK